MRTVRGDQAHSYEEAAYPASHGATSLLQRRNSESQMKQTARYESRNKQRQETNQHSRSNSQTQNEHSQSQLTQSNSQSNQAQTSYCPNGGHGNSMSQRIAQSQSSQL